VQEQQVPWLIGVKPQGDEAGHFLLFNGISIMLGNLRMRVWVTDG
jgi:hypothetical protein